MGKRRLNMTPKKAGRGSDPTTDLSKFAAAASGKKQKLRNTKAGFQLLTTLLDSAVSRRLNQCDDMFAWLAEMSYKETKLNINELKTSEECVRMVKALEEKEIELREKAKRLQEQEELAAAGAAAGSQRGSSSHEEQSGKMVGALRSAVAAPSGAFANLFKTPQPRNIFAGMTGKKKDGPGAPEVTAEEQTILEKLIKDDAKAARLEQAKAARDAARQAAKDMEVPDAAAEKARLAAIKEQERERRAAAQQELRTLAVGKKLAEAEQLIEDGGRLDTNLNPETIWEEGGVPKNADGVTAIAEANGKLKSWGADRSGDLTDVITKLRNKVTKAMKAEPLCKGFGRRSLEEAQTYIRSFGLGGYRLNAICQVGLCTLKGNRTWDVPDTSNGLPDTEIYLDTMILVAPGAAASATPVFRFDHPRFQDTYGPGTAVLAAQEHTRVMGKHLAAAFDLLNASTWEWFLNFYQRCFESRLNIDAQLAKQVMGIYAVATKDLSEQGRRDYTTTFVNEKECTVVQEATKNAVFSKYLKDFTQKKQSTTIEQSSVDKAEEMMDLMKSKTQLALNDGCSFGWLSDGVKGAAQGTLIWLQSLCLSESLRAESEKIAMPQVPPHGVAVIQYLLNMLTEVEHNLKHPEAANLTELQARGGTIFFKGISTCLAGLKIAGNEVVPAAHLLQRRDYLLQNMDKLKDEIKWVGVTTCWTKVTAPRDSSGVLTITPQGLADVRKLTATVLGQVCPEKLAFPAGLASDERGPVWTMTTQMLDFVTVLLPKEVSHHGVAQYLFASSLLGVMMQMIGSMAKIRAGAGKTLVDEKFVGVKHFEYALALKNALRKFTDADSLEKKETLMQLVANALKMKPDAVILQPECLKEPVMQLEQALNTAQTDFKTNQVKGAEVGFYTSYKQLRAVNLLFAKWWDELEGKREATWDIVEKKFQAHGSPGFVAKQKKGLESCEQAMKGYKEAQNKWMGIQALEHQAEYDKIFLETRQHLAEFDALQILMDKTAKDAEKKSALAANRQSMNAAGLNERTMAKSLYGQMQKFK